ncbi:hypothetical protein ISCGN_015727 [Ixodes scapularis]
MDSAKMSASLDAVLRPTVATSVVAWLVVGTVSLVLLLPVLRLLAHWIRMYWILRHMKRPTRVCPGYWFVPELIVVRFWMDTHLSMAARFFNFLEASMATHGEDDLVAFFHGPQAVVVTVTPAAVEGLVNSSNNISKPFPYHFMEPVMGTGLIVRICDGFISRICNVVYWWDILYEFSREGKNYHNISQILRNYCRQGFDTTATAAAFCLYLLGNHLEVQEKLHEELDRVFADDFDRPVTLDDLRDLPYLDCVIKGLVNSSNNISKPFPYHFMEPVMGTGLIVRICDGFISRICNVVYWWDILYEFSREGKNYHNISQILRNYCRQIITARKEELMDKGYERNSTRSFMDILLQMHMQDGTLTEGEQLIPRGTIVITLIYFLQRHRNFYKDPNNFVPERFQENNGRHHYAYIPFFGGPRNCIGQRFAVLKAKVLVAQVMRRFKIKSKHPESELQLEMGIVLRSSQNLDVILERRKRTL